MRNDINTVTCPVCADTFTPNRRQRYCTPACRQAAWRARHPAPRPAIVVPARTRRRDITVYQCTECETRYLASSTATTATNPASASTSAATADDPGHELG
jgi:hypothetical protein